LDVGRKKIDNKNLNTIQRRLPSAKAVELIDIESLKGSE